MPAMHNRANKRKLSQSLAMIAGMMSMTNGVMGSSKYRIARVHKYVANEKNKYNKRSRMKKCRRNVQFTNYRGT